VTDPQPTPAPASTLVAIKCPSCKGKGKRYYQEKCSGRGVGSWHVRSCCRCHGSGIKYKTVTTPTRE
jgi:hypothetical protein